jgi:hypothetical protein
MSNEMYNQEKIFLPSNYQIFLNKVGNKNNNDIFDLNDNQEFINLMNSGDYFYDNQKKKNDICEMTLDELLDKILDKGINSLTDIERKKLEEYSK